MVQLYKPQEDGWKTLNTEGFVSTIGPVWSRPVGQSWEYGMLVEPRHENPLGIAHGGMLVTFIDQAISMIAWTASGRKPCATIQLDTHFLAPAKAGNFIVARATVTRQSATLIFLRGTLSIQDHDILTAQGLMKIVQRSSD